MISPLHSGQITPPVCPLVRLSLGVREMWFRILSLLNAWPLNVPMPMPCIINSERMSACQHKSPVQWQHFPQTTPSAKGGFFEPMQIYSCNQDGPARSRRRRRIQRWLPARALRRVVFLSLVGQQTWYCLHRVHHEDCQNAMTSSVHHMSAESESRRPPHRKISDGPPPPL